MGSAIHWNISETEAEDEGAEELGAEEAVIRPEEGLSPESPMTGEGNYLGNHGQQSEVDKFREFIREIRTEDFADKTCLAN